MGDREAATQVMKCKVSSEPKYRALFYCRQGQTREGSFCRKCNPPLKHAGFNDGVGAFADGTISTGEGAISLSELDANFFRTALGEGVEGSGALLVTEPGLNRLVLNITTEQGARRRWYSALRWPEFSGGDERAIANALEFDAAMGRYEGQLTVDLYTTSDEFGAAVVDRGDAFGATILEVESATFFAGGTADDKSDFLTAVVIPEADPLLGSFENPIQLEEGQTLSGELDFGESVFFREPNLSEVGIEGRINIDGDLFIEEVSATGNSLGVLVDDGDGTFGFSSLADGNLIQIIGGTNDASFNLDVALGQVY